MNTTNRMFRIIRRIIRGENILAISQSPETWDTQFAEGKWDFLIDVKKSPALPTIAALCLDHVKKGPYSLLDVGCGNGALAMLLRDESRITYHGLDISNEALIRARSMYPHGHFYHAPAEAPPHFASRFDLIVFNEVLYYTKLWKVLPCYKTLLTPDGKVIVSMYRSWRTRLLWFVVKQYLRFENTATVKDPPTKRAWIIKQGYYK